MDMFMEQLELSYSAWGSGIWDKHFENCLAGSLKIELVSYDLAILLLSICPREKHACLSKDKYKNAHSSPMIVKHLKTTQIAISCKNG